MSPISYCLVFVCINYYG